MFETLGTEIEDHEEEAFLLFCQSITSQDLGFIDPTASFLDVNIGNRTFLIHQSPTILTSNRPDGTTGAVVWKITPLIAAWMSSTSNLLFRNGTLNSKSSILELGCGISGIVALALKPLVEQYILTDQGYLMKFLKRNLDENSGDFSPKRQARKSGAIKKRQPTTAPGSSLIDSNNVIVATSLDWELDQVNSKLSESIKATRNGFDAIIACDCIYNDALIQPFVQTCVSACEIRPIYKQETKPTVCIIAQQLRSAEVFESWLKSFSQSFRVWRVPDKELTKELRENSGYVVHFGILKKSAAANE
ncbi:hypothetical protein K3495_g10686 [Podosphaera aphanis]|nr:hypothetical protein K3495_g10686 [Podosphaera aphanis]